MRRREFIALLSSVTALPLAAGAQQREQMRRVAVLLGGLEFGDASGQAEIAAFEEGLKKLGWTPGQNIDLDYHWPGAQTARVRAVADEIVRPFKARLRRAGVFGRARERDARDEAELRRERLRARIDQQRAGVEIAPGRDPGPAAAAAAGGLLPGDDP